MKIEGIQCKGYIKPDQNKEMVSIAELKERLNLTIELNDDGTIKNAYFGEPKKRKTKDNN